MLAEDLVRVRRPDDRERYAASQRQARIDPNPHQIDAVIFALRRLREGGCILADEVGLGKTIEACLILNRLVHTRRIERCLVVAPASLTVQWLGELWRKYHQVFTLLDERRLADVGRDFGAGFNPFELHRRAVIALETHPDLARLRQFGFSKRPDASTAVVYAAENYPAKASVLDPSAWYMTVGDRDV